MKVSSVIVLIMAVSLASILGIDTECRRDITFIMESDMTLCDNQISDYTCDYCWGKFYTNFIRGIWDISQLKVNVHVYHNNGLVYGCELDLEQTETCACTSNQWSHQASTIPSLLQVVNGNFKTRRPEVDDVVIVMLANRFTDSINDVARLLRQNKVKVVVVGVGQRVDKAQLLDLATDKYSLVLLDDKQDLLESTSQIRRIACSSCQKDVTFVMAWKESSLQRQQWGWCAGGLISQFVSSIDNQIQVTSVDWRSDRSAVGCQMDWTSFSSNCTCPPSHWSTLTPSLLYETIINKFSNLRPEYPNVVVLFTDRHIGFLEKDMKVFRDNEVLVVTAGIGDEADDTELQNCSTFPNTSFTVEHWSGISTLIPKMRHLVCYGNSFQSSHAGCEDGRTDITFIVDLSMSMTKQIHSVKTFLRSVIDSLNITRTQQHVSVLTFSSKVNVTIHKAENKSDVLRVIETIEPQFGSSNMAMAFRKAAELTRSSPRILSDNGESCPRLSVVILSDGLSGSRKDTLKEARVLKRLGVKLSYVTFKLSGTIYDNEALVSNQYSFYEYGSINSTMLLNVQTEIVQAEKNPTDISGKSAQDCSYSATNVIFIFSVHQNDVVGLFVESFTSHLEAIPPIHVVYPRGIGHPNLPLNATVTQGSLPLADILHDVQTLNITKDPSTCFVIITDNTDVEPASLFKHIWQLSGAGSKVMVVGIGVDIRHYLMERIASVPRYAFSADSVWNVEVPKGIWKRYCEACGFTSPIDIVFYVETSSATFPKWRHIIQFLITSADSFSIGRKNVLVSVVTFGQQILSKISFNTYTNKLKLLNAIQELKPKEGVPDLTAVQKDVKSVFTVNREERFWAKRVIVLILDTVLHKSVKAGDDHKTVLMDVGNRKSSSLQSQYLAPTDFYIKANDVDDIVTYQHELHDIICRNL